MKEFWTIIKKLNWEKDYNYERCAKDLSQLLNNDKNKINQFHEEFYALQENINNETMRRVKNNSDTGIEGGDDKHFMDFPAHLISKGEDEVDKYLNGELMEWQPVECFAYMFHEFDFLDN
jgi:hypothetical protein